MVDPGLKDPEKADRRRLETLFRLSGSKIKPERWVEAAGQFAANIAAADLVSDDAVETADKIRRRLHEHARSIETRAESLASEAAGLLKSFSDIQGEPVDAETLTAEFEAASSAVTRAEQMRDAYAIAKQRQAEAREALESDAGLGDVEAVEREIVDAESCEQLAAARVTEIQAEIKELQDRQKDWQEQRDRAIQRKKDLAEKLDSIKATKAHRERLLAVVNNSLPDTVDLATLEELKAKRDTARTAVTQGEVVRRAFEQRKKAGGLEMQAVELKETAEDCRVLARSTDSVLESGLFEAGFDSVKVSANRLCVETDRGLEPFSELSHGERWRFALELAAKGLPSGSVLPVCQEAFEALDPHNRAEINSMARELGLVIVTAEASSGDLRAEIYVGEQ